jgi:hypothetical protein
MIIRQTPSGMSGVLHSRRNAGCLGQGQQSIERFRWCVTDQRFEVYGAELRQRH